MIKNENINLLPILKPISFKQKFLDNLTGEQLNSATFMLIADDQEYFYFLSCFDQDIDQFELQSNKDIIKIDQNDGITDEGESKVIENAYAVELTKIFKISKKDMFYNLKTSEEQMEQMPYLGIKNQLQVVDRMGEKINSENDKPKIVLIMKGEQNSKHLSKNL